MRENLSSLTLFGFICCITVVLYLFGSAFHRIKSKREEVIWNPGARVVGRSEPEWAYRVILPAGAFLALYLIVMAALSWHKATEVTLSDLVIEVQMAVSKQRIEKMRAEAKELRELRSRVEAQVNESRRTRQRIRQEWEE